MEKYWCIVCGNLINPYSWRRVTCCKYCRTLYKRGYTPYIFAPKRNVLAEVESEARRSGLSYGAYVANTERPVKIIKRIEEFNEKTSTKEQPDMPIYMHCPYYKRDSYLKLYCEGGSLRFPDKISREKYLEAYCANSKEWQKCSVAKCLNEHHEGKE